MQTRFLRNKSSWIVLLLLAAFLFPYLRNCFSDRTNIPTSPTTPPPGKPAVTVTAPPFNADSAYFFVKKQVDFGPRVPGSAAHKKCAAWLAAEFRRHGLAVVEQKFVAKTYFGNLDAVNIIAQYKPELRNRVLISAHWDSRHVADKDAKDKDKPIPGADDGASGVGVLLEIARTLKEHPMEMGVDLICFDAEDLGDDREQASGNSIMTQQNAERTSQTWCLGSQHWAQNLHKGGYTAQFGVLLDMVGAKGARFPYEGYSKAKAPVVQSRIWGIANELGFSHIFINRDGGYVTDDHVFVMKGTLIPMVDIIGMPNDPPSFGAHHHTHADDMNIIDRSTLEAVGKTMLALLYRTEKGAFM